MKTLIQSILILGLVAGCTAYAADQTIAQPGTPGWRHAQMIKAMEDGTFTPGQGPGLGRGPGFGRGMGMMGFGPALALGPDGKIDPSKLPEQCPYRQTATK